MFNRKIKEKIISHLRSDSRRILLVDGARQVGKSFIIRHIGQTEYKYYVEINMIEDSQGPRLFEDVKSIDELYMQISIAAEGKLGTHNDTLVFFDEIQVYPKLLTMLKFLSEEGRYTYIASGSSLGIALKKTVSIPMGSIEQMHMYPMDFEEFLLANNTPSDIIDKMRECFTLKESLPESIHNKVMQLFRYYLLSGGIPDAVKAFVEDRNIPKMRRIQLETHEYYAVDASQYDAQNSLKIRAVYDTIPSNMENKKKRIIAKEIENKKGKTFDSYREEFEYLIYSGTALDVKAVPTPVFPLTQGLEKNLLKLYLNDPGILTALLYGNNINAILKDELSINLGSVYESAVASELKAHGYSLYYYDNRKKGEVDFLVDDYASLSVLPIGVKSGKDYSTHASLDRFISNPDYSVENAYVFSNSGDIYIEGKITYLPIYMCMFLENSNICNPALIPDISW